MTLTIRTIALATIALTADVGAGAAAEPLDILYQDRPPYYVTDVDGTIGGLVAGPVREALEKAGIAATWKVRPGKRQIETIRQNREAACSPGWFKRPEREAFAKFSAPVYRDRPQVVIVRSADLGEFTYPTLTSLFSDERRVFGAKLAYSYGAYVDELIASAAANIQRTPQDVQGMVRMLVGRRFDYMLAAQEEFASLRANLPSASESITAVELRDIPPGNQRYLMCSLRVPDETIARFNAALAVRAP